LSKQRAGKALYSPSVGGGRKNPPKGSEYSEKLRTDSALRARTSPEEQESKNPLRIQRQKLKKGSVLIRAARLKSRGSQRRKKIKVEALEKFIFSQAQEESTQEAQKSSAAVRSA
jgi:hypothetical protein